MKFTPFRIAVIYLFFAILWILITDSIIGLLADDVTLLSNLQSYKGLIYVTGTAIGLYYLSKSYETYLRRDRILFEKLFDKVPVFITKYDPELSSITLNPEFTRVTGWTNRDAKSKQLMENIYPDPDYREKILKFMQNPGNSWMETTIQCKNGDQLTVEWSNIRFSDQTQVGIGINKTKAKQRVEELQMDNERLQQIFDSLPVFINVVENENEVVDINKFTEEKLGYNREELKEIDLFEKIIPDPNDNERVKEKIMHSDGSWFDIRLKARDGSELFTNWTNIRISDTTTLGIGLDITKRKKLEEEYLLAIEGGKVGLWHLYPQTGAIQINDQFAEMLGYKREELEPFTFDDWKKLAHPDDLDPKLEIFKKREQGDHGFLSHEIRMRHKDGRWVWVLDRGEVTETDRKGEIVRVSGTYVDITDRKKLEEEIRENDERLLLTTTSSNVGLWEWYPQTGKVVIDEIWANLAGYKKSELEPVSIDTWNNLVHPDDLQLFEREVEKYFAGETDIYECEIRMRHKEGHWVWILDRGKTVEWGDDGNPVKLVGTHVDITDSKQREQTLLEKEKLLTASQRVAHLGTYIFNVESKMAESSTIMNEIFGLPADQSRTIDKWRELLHPDFKHVADQFVDCLNSRKIFSAEYKILREEDDEIRWIYEKAEPMGDDKQNRQAMIGIVQDITSQKNQQEKLVQVNQRLTQAEKIAKLGYWERDIEDNTLFWSDNLYSLYGYNKKTFEPTVEKFNARLHPEDKESTIKAFREANNTGELQVTYRYFKKDGSIGHFQEIARMVRDEQTGKQIMKGVAIDISLLKQFEEELKNEKNRLSITTNLVSDVIWDWDLKKDTIWWSDGIEQIYGYKRDELPQGLDSWTDRIHPDDIERVITGIRDAIAADRNKWEAEYRFIASDGEEHIVVDRATILRDEVGKATRLIGAMVDLTESRETEKLLRYHASVLKGISDAVISTDENFNIKSWNLAAEKNYGWTEKEALGKKIGDLIKTKYSGTTEKEIFEILPEKGEWNGEVVQYNKDGSPLWILSSIKMQMNKDGDITGIITVNRDITLLKKQQIELKKNRDQLVEAQNTARMGYWELDLETNDLIWSDSIYNIFGLDKTEFDLNYKSFMELVHPGDREELVSTQKKAKETGRLEVTYRVVKPDGTIGYFQERGEILKNRNGKKKLFRGVVLDVTSIKKMEVKLEEEQKRFEIAANITSDVIWEWDKSSNVLWWGDGIENVLGYSKKEFENNPTFWENHIHPDDKERVVKSMNKAENSSDLNFWQEEYRFRAADGQYRFIKDKGDIIRDGSGEITRIIGAMVDVTKEIEYQKTLREERNRFEMIAKSSNDVLYDWDIKNDRVWWSEGWQTRFGYKPENVEQTLDWWVKKVHPSEIEEVEKSLDYAVKSGKSFWSEEYRLLNGNNTYSNVVDKGYFIKDSEGNNAHLVGTITDVTTETKAKYELRASEEQYRLLFQLSPIPMWIYDPVTLQFIMANNAALDKYGYSLKEVQNMKLYELHPESDYEEVLKEIRKSLKQAKTGFDVWTHETKSGDKLIVEISGSNIFYEGKTNRLILTNDITKQRKAEERTISSVVEGEERERQRIAKELHDGLGQYLSASNMNLETVYEDLTDISPKLKKSFKTGLELLNHAILETRTISQNLLPKAIQDYGLNLAVDSLINQLENSHPVKFHLYKNLNGVDIPEKLQINLYRILQESLNNAIRHGKPEKVDVQLVYSKGELLLTIEDNGEGFDTENVSGEGLGLRSIKSRVAAMSANLDISSAIGRGTIISVIVPVEV